MLAVKKISKEFGSVEALSEVSLEIPTGTTTVLIGPSGCGKTTLVRVIMGLVAPDQGVVSFGDTVMREQNIPYLRHRMGYVVQGGALFPHMTAGSNVAVMPRHFGWSSSEIKRKLAYLAEIMDLPDQVLSQFPNELSGGQRQRVSLMRALVLDPDILILDEPFGALDPIVRFQLQTHLRALFRGLGKTVLMVTHDIAEAAFFGDEITLMRNGSIVQRGSISDLLQRPKEEFVETFISAQRSLFNDIQKAK